MEAKEITLKEIQKIEFDMLLELKKICLRHRLRFYIDGGTLLGAYCYGGFIPWDDDIDVKMPRKDYESLLRFRDEFSDYIKVIPPEEDGYHYTFTKIEDTRTVLIEHPGTTREHKGSVYLDILPMDGHPVSQKKLRKIEKFKTLFHGSKNRFEGLRKSDKLISKIKGIIYKRLYQTEKVYKRLVRLAKECDYDSAEHVGLLIEGDRVKETFTRESLDQPAYLLFEGEEFPASTDYEHHLKTFYGEHILKYKNSHDLLYIPSPHEYVVYWKEKKCPE